MKKIIVICILFINGLVGFSQSPINRSNGLNTLIDPNLFASKSFRPAIANDTTEANGFNALDSVGKILFTRSDNKMWKRSGSPKRWEEIGTGGSSANTRRSITKVSDSIQLDNDTTVAIPASRLVYTIDPVTGRRHYDISIPDTLSIAGQIKLSYFPSVAALKASNYYSFGFKMAFTSSYYGNNDAVSGATYIYNDTSTATNNDRWIIQPTGVSGAGRWLYVAQGGIWNMRQLGAKDDASYDNEPILRTLLSYLGVGTNARIFFPRGYLYNFNRGIRLQDFAGELYGDNSTLLFPPADTFMVIARVTYENAYIHDMTLLGGAKAAWDGYANASGGTLANRPSSTTTGYYYYVTDNSTWYQYNGSSWITAAPSSKSSNPLDYKYDGIVCKAVTIFDRVNVTYPSGHGVFFVGDVLSGSQASFSIFNSGHISSAGGAGVFVLGADANRILVSNCDIRESGLVGGLDSSYLGGYWSNNGFHNNVQAIRCLTPTATSMFTSNYIECDHTVPIQLNGASTWTGGDSPCDAISGGNVLNFNGIKTWQGYISQLYSKGIEVQNDAFQDSRIRLIRTGIDRFAGMTVKDTGTINSLNLLWRLGKQANYGIGEDYGFSLWSSLDSFQSTNNKMRFKFGYDDKAYIPNYETNISDSTGYDVMFRERTTGRLRSMTVPSLSSLISSSPSGSYVDTIYRTAGKDSIQFIIGGRYHAIKDSTGGGAGTQDLASVLGFGNSAAYDILLTRPTVGNRTITLQKNEDGNGKYNAIIYKDVSATISSSNPEWWTGQIFYAGVGTSRDYNIMTYDGSATWTNRFSVKTNGDVRVHNLSSGGNQVVASTSAGILYGTGIDPASLNAIINQSASAQSASFWINGTGKFSSTNGNPHILLHRDADYNAAAVGFRDDASLSSSNLEYILGKQPKYGVGGDPDFTLWSTPDGAAFTEIMRWKPAGVLINSLKSGSTAPTTSGTTKMVISDANGLLSFASIPTTSFTPYNGLTKVGTDSLKLGGTGIENTNIDWAAFTFTHTFNSITGNGLSIISTSTAAASNAQKLLNISLSGANANSNQISVAGYFSNTHTGTNAQNRAIQADASGSSSITAYITSTSGTALLAQSSGGTYGAEIQATTGIGAYIHSDNGGTGLSVGSIGGVAFDAQSTLSSTNSVVTVGKIIRLTSGTAADGIGGSLDFMNEADNGTSYTSNQLISKLTTAANATRTSQFIVTGVNSGTTGDIIYFEGDKRTRFNGRAEFLKGADVASAGDLTLGADGNVFHITGTTIINAIITANWQAGSEIILIFDASVTVKNNTSGGAGTAVMHLSGAADFSATASDVLKLVYDGTAFYEVSRSVN